MKTNRLFFWLVAFMTFFSSNSFAQGGAACDSATMAFADTNYADNSGNVDQWYYYVATMDGKITVSSWQC